MRKGERENKNMIVQIRSDWPLEISEEMFRKYSGLASSVIF